MIAEGFALLLSLATLGFAFGTFVLPNVQRASRCLLGAGLGVAVILWMANAELVAWALAFTLVSLFLIHLATPQVARSGPSGWHNWFAVVVTASSLWLLCLFLLWTLEEALSQPVEVLAVPPAVWEVLSLVFDRYLWVAGLLVLLSAAIAWSAVGMAGEAE